MREKLLEKFIIDGMDRKKWNFVEIFKFFLQKLKIKKLIKIKSKKKIRMPH